MLTELHVLEKELRPRRVGKHNSQIMLLLFILAGCGGLLTGKHFGFNPN